MKNTLVTFLASLALCACGKKINNTRAIKNGEAISIYTKDFALKTLTGEDFDLESLKGKKIMLVNTASKCGLTPQYDKLEELYEEYKDKNFVVIGFPANDFMHQEPGNNDEIASFCKKNYGVSFPMMSKVSVKGDTMHPLYQFLTQKTQNGVADSKVAWNFQKYLIDEEGYVQYCIPPTTSPKAKVILNWLNQ